MQYQTTAPQVHAIAIEVELEVQPLSVNQAWQGQRFKTEAYKNYEEEMLLRLPNKNVVEGEVEVTYDFYVPDNRRRDISNFIKPLEDIIVKKGYITDDSKIVKFTVVKHQHPTWKIRVLILRHSPLVNSFVETATENMKSRSLPTSGT